MERRMFLAVGLLVIGLCPQLGYSDVQCTATCEATLHYQDPSAPQAALETAKPVEVNARGRDSVEAKSEAQRLCPEYETSAVFQWRYLTRFEDNCGRE